VVVYRNGGGAFPEMSGATFLLSGVRLLLRLVEGEELSNALDAL
jgi:hypothetical protein